MQYSEQRNRNSFRANSLDKSFDATLGSLIIVCTLFCFFNTKYAVFEPAEQNSSANPLDRQIASRSMIARTFHTGTFILCFFKHSMQHSDKEQKSAFANPIDKPALTQDVRTFDIVYSLYSFASFKHKACSTLS
ncbi:hypothetical protein AVEN_147329-1 [Araneus ventricosus]|uniref:Uncharacterized protein n=1 Tax=Araneus ventricosus TaxID=182803 RepID=A0A4Y2NW55_ARAVE|nr:hypothetical protein AVEN_147329-1 [Araneus ventricosus]